MHSKFSDVKKRKGGYLNRKKPLASEGLNSSEGMVKGNGNTD